MKVYLSYISTLTEHIKNFRTFQYGPLSSLEMQQVYLLKEMAGFPTWGVQRNSWHILDQIDFEKLKDQLNVGEPAKLAVEVISRNNTLYSAIITLKYMNICQA